VPPDVTFIAVPHFIVSPAPTETFMLVPAFISMAFAASMWMAPRAERVTSPLLLTVSALSSAATRASRVDTRCASVSGGGVRDGVIEENGVVIEVSRQGEDRREYVLRLRREERNSGAKKHRSHNAQHPPQMAARIRFSRNWRSASLRANS